MSMDLFKKILREAESVEQIVQVCITGLGEPLLDSELEDKIRFAREMKPFAFIDVFTNGVYLTPKRFIQLRDAGLTSLQISINAVRAEQHEQIMGLKGKFDTVVRNAKWAINNRKTCAVEIRAVINKDSFTEEDGNDFIDMWGVRGHGGYGALITEGNWAGDNRTIRSFKPNEACHRALSQVYVMYDGRVTTCCFDPVGRQVFGDLNKQTLREVYVSPAYVDFREAHDRNEADKYKICAECTRI